jgi:hypothetical protein
MRNLSLTITLLLTAFQAAYGSGGSPPGIPPAMEPKTGNHILVAYFSCTGTTGRIAEWIAEQTSADLYQITPETPYTSADLDYRNSRSRTTVEQNDPAARPAISGSAANMDK